VQTFNKMAVNPENRDWQIFPNLSATFPSEKYLNSYIKNLWYLKNYLEDGFNMASN